MAERVQERQHTRHFPPSPPLARWMFSRRFTHCASFHGARISFFALSRAGSNVLSHAFSLCLRCCRNVNMQHPLRKGSARKSKTATRTKRNTTSETCCIADSLRHSRAYAPMPKQRRDKQTSKQKMAAGEIWYREATTQNTCSFVFSFAFFSSSLRFCLGLLLFVRGLQRRQLRLGVCACVPLSSFFPRCEGQQKGVQTEEDPVLRSLHTDREHPSPPSSPPSQPSQRLIVSVPAPLPSSFCWYLCCAVSPPEAEDAVRAQIGIEYTGTDVCARALTASPMTCARFGILHAAPTGWIV